ncbi:MAG TPA: CpsB/CapC family capsule biosynthesis tyrosine phosphatase [Longimicrobiales bacterium]
MAITDFHNHLIPGVDDGAQTVADSVAGITAFIDSGVGAFVATPHVDAALSLYPPEMQRRLAEIDQGWEALTALCAEKFPGLGVYRGAELLLDVPEPDLSDPRLRINGGEFFLVEFPYMTVPPNSARVLGQLRAGGFTPVLAHPERYHGLSNIDLAGEWRQAGAYLQVNGGSLLGRYGNRAQQHAFELLRRGWADYICSDYHARGSPLIGDYTALLIECDAEEQAHTLMQTNPERLLRGQVPLPVAGLRPPRKSIWQRVGGLFR